MIYGKKYFLLIFIAPSAFGVLVVTVLKMLTSTRKSVTKRAIRPGMMSGGTTKLGKRSDSVRAKNTILGLVDPQKYVWTARILTFKKLPSTSSRQ